MILPDTSAWVQYLRGEPSTPSTSEGASLVESLERLIAQEQILTCGPVVAELLAGARGHGRESLATQLGVQPWIALERADWLTIGHTAAKLQEQGRTTPLLDVQIAACAVKADAELWTLDGDFQRIAETLGELRVRIFEP